MAYIVGLATEQEIEELERRGWDIEDPPEQLKSEEKDGHKSIMVFVDADLFQIMDGPDWEKD